MPSRSRLTLAALSLSFALCSSAVTAKPVTRGSVARPVAALSLWEALTAKLGILLSGTCDNRGGLDPWGCPQSITPPPPTTNDAPSCDSRGSLDPWGCPSR
jgi:hypothetical protein